MVLKFYSGVTKTKKLDIIQKREVRILAASKYNAHTGPLFKQLNLLKVSNMYKIQEIKLYFKLVHKQLSIYFNNSSSTKPITIDEVSSMLLLLAWQHYKLHTVSMRTAFVTVNQIIISITHYPKGWPP